MLYNSSVTLDLMAGIVGKTFAHQERIFVQSRLERAILLCANLPLTLEQVTRMVWVSFSTAHNRSVILTRLFEVLLSDLEDYRCYHLWDSTFGFKNLIHNLNGISDDVFESRLVEGVFNTFYNCWLPEIKEMDVRIHEDIREEELAKKRLK